MVTVRNQLGRTVGLCRALSELSACRPVGLSDLSGYCRVTVGLLSGYCRKKLSVCQVGAQPATPASLGGTWQVARCTPWETDCTFTCNALKHTHPNIRKREKLSSAHTIPRGSTARAQRAHLPTAGCTQKRETGSHCEALQNRP